MRSLDALDLELQAVVSCLEALGTKFESPERTANILALNFSALRNLSLKCICFFYAQSFD